MGLKQNIVVVNEFSVKTKDGGSRGGTPGDYVLRYMAREGAVEDIAPVRKFDEDTYITKYMARKEATEVLDNVASVRKEIREGQGLGGVSFGMMDKDDDGDISMSDRKVRRISKKIQEQFDEGKTVMKTVLSFDLEYLKHMGIVNPDFEPEKEGDYRGNIDQMRLRAGIMDGMKRMGKAFDNLAWVGVIQVDTMNVHAHLAMVDTGAGRLLPNGEQRGKLNQQDMRVLRRGLDLSLDDTKQIQMMASNVAYDRRNARMFIKKYTHETMSEHGLPQFLLSTLPENKNHWRASTNRADMRKANAIVREYVEEILEQPDSGYSEAMRDIASYADERASREGLDAKSHRRLINDGRERLVEDCMNGIYQILKDVPDEERQTMTPMLSAMSMDYEQLAQQAQIHDPEPMVEFGFRLRSYSSRLNHHKKERRYYKDRADAYQGVADKDMVSEDSKPLYDFYRIEEEYNEKLMAKYQHFLAFIPNEDKYKDAFDELLEYRDRLRRMNRMREDKSMRRMKEDNAEDYGVKVYDMRGGAYMVTNPDILTRRHEAMHETYQKKEADFKSLLSDYGLQMEETKIGVGIKHEPLYDFHEVKAVDIHHLGYDFPNGADISVININVFVDMANRRYDAYLGAKNYLEKTDQLDVVRIQEKDIVLMKEMADSLLKEPFTKPNELVEGGRTKKGKTISLDRDYNTDMRLMVQSTVQSVSQTLGYD